MCNFFDFPLYSEEESKKLHIPGGRHSPPLILTFTVGICSPSFHPRRRSGVLHVSATSKSSQAVPQRHASVPPSHTLSRMQSHLSKPLLTSTLPDNGLPRLRVQYKESWIASHNWVLCSCFFFLKYQKKKRKKRYHVQKPTLAYLALPSSLREPWYSTRQVFAPRRHHRPQATRS